MEPSASQFKTLMVDRRLGEMLSNTDVQTRQVLMSPIQWSASYVCLYVLLRRKRCVVAGHKQMVYYFLNSVMRMCFFGTEIGAVSLRHSPDDHEFCNHVRVCVPFHSRIGASFFLDRPDYN